MNVRLYFKVTQLHQLEVDTSKYPDAPQDDPDAFAGWFKDAYPDGAHEDLLERIDDFRSWVDTEDEVEITECFEVGTAVGE